MEFWGRQPAPKVLRFNTIKLGFFGSVLIHLFTKISNKAWMS